MRITAEADLTALKREDTWMTTRTVISAVLTMVGLPIAITSAVFLVKDHRQTQRAVPCSATMQRLLSADTLVALEREKFLLKEMDCSVWRQMRDLSP